MNKAKPFCISKREVWMAYKRVKANRGAAGVDNQSITEFEGTEKQSVSDLESDVVGQLSSAAGLAGGHTERRWWTRPLGIPTISDESRRWW